MTPTVIGIDPGSTHSGFVVWDGIRPSSFGKFENSYILRSLRTMRNELPVVIEGMNLYAAGNEIRDALLWSGRFQEAVENRGVRLEYIMRSEVLKHLTGKGSRVGDPEVIAALVRRFGGTEHGKYGKGTIKNNGFFYGFVKDVWQAHGLAVTWFDFQHIGRNLNERRGTVKISGREL